MGWKWRLFFFFKQHTAYEIGLRLEFRRVLFRSIDMESTVQEAAQFMLAHNIGSVLIKEFEKYVGIVTETDLTRKVLGKGLNAESTGISEIMTSPILSLDCYLPVEEANRFMHKNKIRHLAVTEEDKIIGILSVKDLVAYFSKDFRMQE